MIKRILSFTLLGALALPLAAGAAPPAETSVVGGRTAQIEAWPSIAFLLSAWDEDGDGELESAAGCTGTVIRPQWILTAAHCAFRPDGKGVDAMLSVTGTADIGPAGVGEAIPADKVVVHPGWSPQTLAGDMLLMHLPKASSRPAMPLAQAGVEYGLSPTVPNAAGWGLTDEAASVETSVLQEAFLVIQDDDEVCKVFDPSFDSATQTCAGTPDTSGVCRGDSGGPLTVLDQAGTPHLWGVTSYGTQLMHGLPPCSLEAPAVFSWVPGFASWIGQTTAAAPPPPPITPPPTPRPLPTTPPDTTPPALTGAKLSTTKFRAARRGATIARKTGAKLSFTLSEAAAVRVSVRKGTKAVGSPIMIAGQAGKTTKRFTGRAGSKKLRPGRYTLELGATDAGGNAAKPVRIGFRVIR